MCTGVFGNPPLTPAVTVARVAPGRDTLTCSCGLKPEPDTVSAVLGGAWAADRKTCGPVVAGLTVTVILASAWPTSPSPPTARAVNCSTPPDGAAGTPSVQLTVVPAPLSVAGL